jgi:hypothetical protein
LPSRRLPSSGFLTLSTVCSHRGRVALFHATPAHRISTFRAFPTQPAVTPLDARCSLAVESARTFVGCPTLAFAPIFAFLTDPTPLLLKIPPRCSCNIRTVADISHETCRRTSKPNDERPTPTLKRHTRRPGWHQQARSRTSEADSDGRGPRLQSLTPVEQPFSSGNC